MPESIVSRMHVCIILACLVFALAGFADAKTKKGALKITAAVNVGAVTLEPGKHEVKQVNSSAGPLIRFTRVTYNPYGPQECLSPYDWKMVAEVNRTVEPLSSPPQHTVLLFDASRTKIIGLEIRGNSVTYRF
jgi:hypothetical protein